jgi:hypothetical protein
MPSVTFAELGPSLFCHGDGSRSSLFFWDGKRSYEFADIEFIIPDYLDHYLACTNFLFKLNSQDRKRVIKVEPLLNSFNKSFARFAKEEKSLFYNYCLKDQNCHIKFPYSLLEPKVFWNQTFKKESPISFEENEDLLKPKAIKFPDDLKIVYFWDLPEVDFIKEFWRLAKKQKNDRIVLSAMTFSMDFLKEISHYFKNTKTEIIILASFNIMALEHELTTFLYQKPQNIIFIPIYQTSKAPFSHHQKGAIFYHQKASTLIWTSSNFRRYETTKLKDIGMTIQDQDFASTFAARWMDTASTSCQSTKAISNNLNVRFSNHPNELFFWRKLTKESCSKVLPPNRVLENQENVDQLILRRILMAKKTIYVHTHILGNGPVFHALKDVQSKGIDVKIVIGKPSRFTPDLPWLRVINSDKEYHAKFIIIDNSTFIWGTGNITKTSLNNQREDYFHGHHEKVLIKLNKYFEDSWAIGK